MHILVIGALTVVGSLTEAKATNDGSWCYRDFGAARPSNCSFYSVQQCLIVAGTFGGVCERNSPPPPKKEKRRAS
jgi:hypothetical protein